MRTSSSTLVGSVKRSPRAIEKIFAVTILAIGHWMVAEDAKALTIPSNTPHPRLWFGNAQRLADARSYAQSHPVPIPGYPLHATARNRALRFLMNGNVADCTAAIDQLMRYSFTASDEDGDGDADPGSCDLNSEGRYCDRARWGGEDAILTFDWCHAHLSATQKTTLIDRWNHYIGQLNVGPYGWQDRPINNYNWGYLRNSLLWGIATAGDNPRAQEFIDHGLNVRFGQYFAPWSAGFGRGGVPGEGTQYGGYPLGYSVIALQTVKDFGFDPFEQTAFFDEAVYYLNYATSPAPTNEPSPGNPRYEMFPFNDDHDFESGGSAMRSDYADMLGAQILRAPTSARARHARSWLTRTGVAPEWWLRAALASAPGASNNDDLPLDYFAAGYKMLYTRSDRSPNAMTTMLQMGAIGGDERGGTEHNGLESGSFQIWRKGQWASRESAGYRGSDYVRGLGSTGRVGAEHPMAHNTVLFEGDGQRTAFHAQPTLLRLHSADNFAFIAADLRNAYRSHAGAVPSSQCWLAQDDWPFAAVAIREFIVLRQWHAIVVVDRLRSNSDSQLPVYADSCGGQGYSGPRKPAAAVEKTFLTHFRTLPSINGNRATATLNNQALDAHMLLPSSGTRHVTDERNCANCGLGQFRLEVTQSGTADSYFLNVLHARDTSESPITATLIESGNDWTLNLVRGNGDTATVRLVRGMTSVGGSVQFGSAPATALYDGVQGMTVEASGPVWEDLLGDVFANGFE